MCDHTVTKIVRGTGHRVGEQMRRTRICEECGYRFTTVEIPFAMYKAFQRFRALVRLHPEDYLELTDLDQSYADYSEGVQ